MRSSRRVASFWFIGLSSARRMRSGRSRDPVATGTRRASPSAPGSTASTGAADVTKASSNRLPCPGIPGLVTVSVPPISSASRRLIARPSPVPPYLRAIEASVWLNDWNSRDMPSSVMPMPVSWTDRRTCQPPSTGSVAVVSVTLPVSVNFTAFDSRFRTICRIRPGSPSSRGASPVDTSRSSMAFLSASGRISSAAPWTVAAKVERDRLQVEPPGLDLREVEDVVDYRQQGLARGADALGVVALLGRQRRSSAAARSSR